MPQKVLSEASEQFCFLPFSGSLWGLITIWNSSVYKGETIQSNSYCVTVKFSNNFDNICFFVSNVYGPSNAIGKLAFITWFLNLDCSSFDEWIIAGDFNLYKFAEDRNRPGGDPGDMSLFNNFISDMELVDIPFSGRTYTWSNMEKDPLLIKLDWVFCNASWNYHYPSTIVQPLSKPTYVINFGSSIPKVSIFRFENFWADHADFLKIVDLHWNSTTFYSNAAKTLNAKFKQTRLGLKQWRKIFIISTDFFTIVIGSFYSLMVYRSRDLYLTWSQPSEN